MEPTYKIGDKVKVIKYGSLWWKYKNPKSPVLSNLISEDDKCEWYDLAPQIVGQVGVISQVRITQDCPKYSITGIPEKIAWYSDDQLELVK